MFSSSNPVDVNGNTLLHDAARKNDEFYVRKIEQNPFLDINQMLRYKNSEGYIPLHIAFEKKHLHMGNFLINYTPEIRNEFDAILNHIENNNSEKFKLKHVDASLLALQMLTAAQDYIKDHMISVLEKISNSFDVSQKQFNTIEQIFTVKCSGEVESSIEDVG